MQELIKIQSVPATLAINFNELRDHLATELERYDVLVTDETLPGAKKLATELNQTAKAIDDKRKEAVAAVSEPVRKFDEQMKSLVTMCRDGRQRLIDQIKVFEDEAREKVRVLLQDAREALWEKHEVRAEFRAAQYDDLVILSALTKAENLAAKQYSELEARIVKDKSLQDRTDRRLLELENASYRAGLSAPLTRDHVAGFLMSDDEDYTAELERIIAAEIRREEEAQRRMREKMEREQRERAELAQAFDQADSYEERVNHSDLTPSGTAPAPWEEKAEVSTSGKIRVTVWACFTPDVPANATDTQIEAALRTAMTKAGITTLQSIQIEREQQEAAE